MSSKLIAVDFDDTFTADPEWIADCVRSGRARGHRFIMVTARRETEANSSLINEMLDKYGCQMCIYFTGLASKLEHMQKLGIKVDIWMDDDPETLVRGH